MGKKAIVLGDPDEEDLEDELESDDDDDEFDDDDEGS